MITSVTSGLTEAIRDFVYEVISKYEGHYEVVAIEGCKAASDELAREMDPEDYEGRSEDAAREDFEDARNDEAVCAFLRNAGYDLLTISVDEADCLLTVRNDYTDASITLKFNEKDF